MTENSKCTDPGDLLRFCEPNDIRSYCAAPFTKDGYTWYTNGHILIRVAEIAGIPGNDVAPDVTKKFDENWITGEWLPVPACAAPPDNPCVWCCGIGEAECNMGCVHECDFCDGTGFQEASIGMDVGNAYLNQKYLAKIQGWEISTRGPDKAACIRCGDVRGILMPMRRPRQGAI